VVRQKKGSDGGSMELVSGGDLCRPLAQLEDDVREDLDRYLELSCKRTPSTIQSGRSTSFHGFSTRAGDTRTGINISPRSKTDFHLELAVRDIVQLVPDPHRLLHRLSDD